MNEHITPETIKDLVNGQSSEADRERWLMHMDQCEQCLASMDQHWATPFGGDAPPLIPNLDVSQARSIEGRILRHIHATEVGKQALRLALVGPVTLLKGLFGTTRRRR
jgi:hypothetical protein